MTQTAIDNEMNSYSKIKIKRAPSIFAVAARQRRHHWKCLFFCRRLKIMHSIKHDTLTQKLLWIALIICFFERNINDESSENVRLHFQIFCYALLCSAAKIAMHYTWFTAGDIEIMRWKRMFIAFFTMKFLNCCANMNGVITK